MNSIRQCIMPVLHPSRGCIPWLHLASCIMSGTPTMVLVVALWCLSRMLVKDALCQRMLHTEHLVHGIHACEYAVGRPHGVGGGALSYKNIK